MSIIDRLRTRSTKPAGGPAAAPIKTETNLFRAVYGDAQSTRQATVVTVVTDAEADQLMAQPLSEAQQAGIKAQIELSK